MCTELRGRGSRCSGPEGDREGLASALSVPSASSPPGRRPGAGSPEEWNFPTNGVEGEGKWGSSKRPPPAWGGGPGKVWGTEPLARLWGWGVHPPTRRSNNIGVGGGALGAHSSLHSLRPPPAFPMEDRQGVINHQLPPLPTQAALGRGAHGTETA